MATFGRNCSHASRQNRARRKALEKQGRDDPAGKFD